MKVVIATIKRYRGTKWETSICYSGTNIFENVKFRFAKALQYLSKPVIFAFIFKQTSPNSKCEMEVSIGKDLLRRTDYVLFINSDPKNTICAGTCHKFYSDDMDMKI